MSSLKSPENQASCTRMKATPEGGGTPLQGLTHSLDSTKEGLAMKATQVCSVEGCDLPYMAKGMCNGHYGRWARNGPAMSTTPVVLRGPNSAPGTPCSVSGCSRPQRSRGLCVMHASRFYKTGDVGGPNSFSDPSGALRIEAKTKRDGECIRWTGAHQSNGYGQIRIEGRNRYAHRVAYELAKGPIPQGLEIDHLCSVRDCVNPDHLEPVTHAENLRRARARVKVEVDSDV